METLVIAILGFIVGSVVAPIFNGFFEEAGKKIFHHFNKTPTDVDIQAINKLDEYHRVFRNSIFYFEPISKNHADTKSLFKFIAEISDLSPTSKYIKLKLNKVNDILSDLLKEINKNYTSGRSDIEDIEESQDIARDLDGKRLDVITKVDSLLSTLITETHEKKRT